MTDRYTGPVGLQRPQSPILGPGGITGSGGAPAPAQTSDEMAQWGAQAGQLARRASMRPQLPDVGDTPRYPIGPGGVSNAPTTVRAAHAAGVPERYLTSLVGQESGGDANAQAQTSSATGLGQFTDQTWLNMMGAHAERYGQPQIAAAFERSGDGRYKLTNPAMRDSILDLRHDPTWSALMTGEYARENDLAMRQALGRDLNQGEVYLGHWLGPAEATTFIHAYDQSRRGSGRGPIARSVVSDATFQANMPVFYTPDAQFRLVDVDGGRKRYVHEGGGRLRSVSEVYQAQTARFGGDRNLFIPQDRVTTPAGPPSP